MAELPFTEQAKKVINDKSNFRKCSPDIPPCGLCKAPIFEDVPLRLFNESDNTEIAFHFDCAFQPGTFQTSKEAENEIIANMENCDCFFCEKLEACTFISNNYKGEKKK